MILWNIIEGSLEVKLPTIWTHGKAEVGRVSEEKSRREKIREEKEEKKEDAGTRKGRKVAKHSVFPMICGSTRSKSRLAKAAGAEPCGQMRVEKLHAVVARSTCPSQNVQSTPTSDHFWKLRCRKVHAVVAPSTFPSQNVQNTPTSASDHFWKLTCRKGACCCGAKHISKSKGTKHLSPGALWKSKKCTQLWREAHFEVKMLKTPHLQTTFGRSDVVSRGRRKGLCTLSKWAKRVGFVACPNTMAGVGHLKRIWKDACRVADAVQETCSSEMLGGPGADFLIRSSVLGWWFCVTGAALRMTWHHFFVPGGVL